MQSPERKREIYLERKEKGLCVKCGKNYTDNKHLKCDICRQKERDYRIKNRENLIEYGKKRREILRQVKICIRCGKNEAIAGLSSCYECLQRVKNRKHIYTKEEYKIHCENMKTKYAERKKQGICVKCGKRKALPNRVKCLECTLYLNQSRSGYVEHTGQYIRNEIKAGRLKA